MIASAPPHGHGRSAREGDSLAYDPAVVEAGWQARWQRQGTYNVVEDPNRPKYYCLDFFPYPSGDGLSVGHCRNYVPTDTLSRFLRARGYNVLHPMGWDAFGEPAEQYAVSQGVHPRVTTDRNAANYRRQYDLIGISFDWSRELDSSDPDYYRWTQWIFTRLYRKGLAYRDANWQWWCPGCQTTLSNQEAQDGVCWRGHTGLTKRQIPAWYFRITAYADKLLDGLETIDWPDRIRAMQSNWIGRSTGVQVEFVSESGVPLPIFTTHPDTLFGVTFMVIAPEHPSLPDLVTDDHRAEVEAYVEASRKASEIDRLATDRPKTGVFTGSFAINPLNGDRVQVWVADYVLATYGTGIVMGVPAHDTRDFAFAKTYGVPIKMVVSPFDWDGSRTGDDLPDAYTAPGYMVNSPGFDGMVSPGDWPKLGPNEKADLAATWGFAVADMDARVEAATENAITAIGDAVVARNVGKRVTNYRMRDWLISRQRYWGAPIPIIHCDACGEVPVPEDQLPVELPPMVDFMPDGTGRSPLARAEEWVRTTCPTCHAPARRETDTMGGFACSSWYFLRFASPGYKDGPFRAEDMAYWLPVDQYVGGAEHAVLHLLYSRFWTHFLHDEGMLPFAEPFTRLRNQGMLVVKTPHRRANDENATEEWVPITAAEAATLGPEAVTMRAAKMSKSLRNVVTPDEMVARYGADSLRLYELFMAPFDQEVEWSEEGINGARRFLGRVWDLVVRWHAAHDGTTSGEPDTALVRLQHKTIARVTRDMERFRFNTMVAALMEFANALGERARTGTANTGEFAAAIETLVRLLAPTTPFLSEALWQLTGGFGRAPSGAIHAGDPDSPFTTEGPGSIHAQSWPVWDEGLARDETVTIAVQVNGKVRDRVEVAAGASEDVVRAAALERARVREFVPDLDGARYHYVADRLLSIVVAKG
jgi:leucyl-tRNA synthetase